MERMREIEHRCQVADPCSSSRNEQIRLTGGCLLISYHIVPPPRAFRLCPSLPHHSPRASGERISSASGFHEHLPARAAFATTHRPAPPHSHSAKNFSRCARWGPPPSSRALNGSLLHHNRKQGNKNNLVRASPHPTNQAKTTVAEVDDYAVPAAVRRAREPGEVDPRTAPQHSP